MKRARIINAALCTLGLLAVSAAVLKGWRDCDAQSILLAIAYYTTGFAVIGYVVDVHLREQER